MACQLTLQERETIAQMRYAGDSQADIARALERDPSTISRELRRNGPVEGYTASSAQQQASLQLESTMGRP